MTRNRMWTHAATFATLLAVLTAAGCMSSSATQPADVASLRESTIAPASSECEALGCMP